jgi:myo-inositol 2-dehydrogenase / D-chiro-inositol 1-dehydrogenase
MIERESNTVSKGDRAWARREFMAGTAMLAAFAAVGKVAAVRAAEGEAPVRKVKLGVVGCGGRGAWIAKLFRDHGGYEMHAVADYFQSVADAAGDALGVDASRRFSGLSGYRRLIDSGVEAVALETPPCFFPEHVQAAVEAGLHVFMAKPVAIDVPGCRQVEAAAKKADGGRSLLPGGLPDAHRSARDRVRQALPGRGTGNAQHGEELLLRRAVRRSAADGNIESRLRSLVWVNDTAIGGCYHVNACIHPIQAMMWVLDKVPVAAAGIS